MTLGCLIHTVPRAPAVEEPSAMFVTDVEAPPVPRLIALVDPAEVVPVPTFITLFPVAILEILVVVA